MRASLAIVVLSGESAVQAAGRFLAAKHLLLVVDNFEHLLAAAPFIGRLLNACPALTVLATSREPLALHECLGARVAPGPRRRQERMHERSQMRLGVDAYRRFLKLLKPAVDEVQ